MAKVRTVPEIMKANADLYRQRNKNYKDGYKNFGRVMMGLYPDGLTLKTEEEFNKLGVFVMIVSKVMRIASSDMEPTDNVDDLQVYAAMLKEIGEDEQLVSSFIKEAKKVKGVAGCKVKKGK